MLTGYTDLQDLADAVNLGGVEYYVTKPWDADELVEVLERAAAMARRAEKRSRSAGKPKRRPTGPKLT